MATVDDRKSRLNPNAPLFVPNAAFSEVEDFSPEWWDLVKTSSWFRDYWLSEYQEDYFISSLEGEGNWLQLEFPIIDDIAWFVESQEKTELASKKGGDPLNGFVEFEAKTELAPKKEGEPLNGLKNGMDAKALLKYLNVLLKHLNVNLSKSPKGRGPKSPVSPSKYCDKKLANKCVMNQKCTATRRIHQPR